MGADFSVSLKEKHIVGFWNMISDRNQLKQTEVGWQLTEIPGGRGIV